MLSTHTVLRVQVECTVTTVQVHTTVLTVKAAHSKVLRMQV